MQSRTTTTRGIQYVDHSEYVFKVNAAEWRTRNRSAILQLPCHSVNSLSSQMRSCDARATWYAVENNSELFKWIWLGAIRKDIEWYHSTTEAIREKQIKLHAFVKKTEYPTSPLSHRIFQADLLTPSRIPSLQLSPFLGVFEKAWRGVLDGCSGGILRPCTTVLEPVETHSSSADEP